MLCAYQWFPGRFVGVHGVFPLQCFEPVVEAVHQVVSVLQLDELEGLLTANTHYHRIGQRVGALGLLYRQHLVTQRTSGDRFNIQLCSIYCPPSACRSGFPLGLPSPAFLFPTLGCWGVSTYCGTCFLHPPPLNPSHSDRFPTDLDWVGPIITIYVIWGRFNTMTIQGELYRSAVGTFFWDTTQTAAAYMSHIWLL